MKKFPLYKQHDVMDCGPTCLRMVAAYHGKRYSLEGLREKCHITREGVSMLGLSEAADLLGLRTICVQVGFEMLKEAPLPCIVHWNQQHFVVVYRVNQNINVGDKVFSVVNGERGIIIGKIKLPVVGSGKVREGQRVNIQLSGYPYMEYGFLAGKISSISLMPDDDAMYAINVDISQDMTTSYGKVIEMSGDLQGIAEVLTDERSVMERLFSPLRYLWEKYH